MAVDINITGQYLQNGVPIGGGGGGGIHALLPPSTGNVVSYNTTTTGLGSTGQISNRLITAPFIPATSFTSINLLIRVNIGVALSLAKILIYSDLNGDPNNLLYESTSIDCSTTGNKIVTITFSFTAGETYWLAYWGNSTQNVFTIAPANMYAIRNQGSIPAPANLLANVILFGTAPNPITGLLPTTTTMPFIGITQA